MKKIMLLILIGMLFCSGCGGTDLSKIWLVKSEMTTGEWEEDKRKCEYDAKKAALSQTPSYAGAPHPFIYPQIFKELFLDCMASKGYHIVPVGTPKNEW